MGVPDLLNVAFTEISLDNTTSYVNAEAIKTLILACIFNVKKLSDVSFLASTGFGAKTPTTTSHNDRTKDLSYIRLSCTINAHSINRRVTQDPICLTFCLKIPQPSFDGTSGVITAIDMPIKPTVALSIPPVASSTMLYKLGGVFVAAAGSLTTDSLPTHPQHFQGQLAPHRLQVAHPRRINS